VIICLFRSHSPKENRKAFGLAKKHYGRGVTGIDLAGDESLYPTKDFAEFFEEANHLDFFTTCHAGEVKGLDNLRSALEFKVHRIGHGIHLMEDEKLLKEVVQRQVPLEIGLTSNIRTHTVSDYSLHPLRRFFAAGVPVSINTDDRGIFGIDLVHEYEAAMTHLRFSPEEILRIASDSIGHLFLDEERKSHLRHSFEQEVSKLKKPIL